MRGLLDEFRPDVVHTHKLYPQLSVAPVVVAARAGIPVVQTLHDFEMISASPIDARGGRWDPDEPAPVQAVERALRPVHRRVHAPRVSAFVSVSRFVARVHATHGIDATVSPNFVRRRRRSRSRLSFDERAGAVFLGRLRPEKGALDVVELARKLLRSGDDRRLRRPGGHDPSEAARPEPPRCGVRRRPGSARSCGELASSSSRRAVRTPAPWFRSRRWRTRHRLSPTRWVGWANTSATREADAWCRSTSRRSRAAAELHDERETWGRSRAGFDAVVSRHTPAVYAERLEGVYGGAISQAARGDQRTLVTGGAGYVGSSLVPKLLDRGTSVRVLDSLAVGTGDSRTAAWAGTASSSSRATFATPRRESRAGGRRHGRPSCCGRGRPGMRAGSRCGSGGQPRWDGCAHEAKRPASIGSSSRPLQQLRQLVDGDAFATEEWELRPVSLYAETKVAAELDVLAAAGAGFATSLRFATVYGVSPSMRFDLTVNEFARDALVNGELVVYGEQFWRPYVHVRDAARAVAAVLSRPAGE